MRWLRVVAAVLALSLMIGELWRSWGAGRHPLFILDDQVMGGFLLAAAWAMGVDTRRNRAAFAGAWGTCAGMLYGSFFGKLVEPASTNPGNWNLGVLTALIGVAFATALVGLWFSITLPSADDR
jgi:hypothetical protein